MSSSSKWRTVEKALSRVPDFLWLGAIIFTILGLTAPDTFNALRPYTSLLLGSVILAMGLTLRLEDFKRVFMYPKAVGVCILSQYTVMPLAGFIVGYVLLRHYEVAWLGGQVLTGTSPTGVVSNVYTYIGGGNVALSITASAVNTVLSPLLTPILTYILAGAFIPVDVVGLFLDIVQVVIVPVVLGLTLNTFFGKYIQRVKVVLPVWSTIAVVVIVGIVVSGARSRILAMTPVVVVLLVAASLIHLAAGYVLGWFYGVVFKQPVENKITISTETAMQNSGLATVLALKYWGATAALPAVVYSVVQNIIGPFVASLVMRKKLRRLGA